MSGSDTQRFHCPIYSTQTGTFDLPAEVLLHIFSYLDTASLSACSQTCKYWRDLLISSDTLWKFKCLTLIDSAQQIEEDRRQGLTWREAFQQNYGANGVKRLWRQGKLSNPGSYKDIPANPFCVLDVQSWGEIFKEELERT